MLYTHNRSAWVDPNDPVIGLPFNWDTIEWVVIHYTAAIDLPDGDMGEFDHELPPYLRAVQREYLRRGYSIGYNAAVDWLGGTWELRGDTFKCAANADREDTIESEHDKGGDENARTFAILMLVDGQDGATPLAAAAVRGLVAQVREHAPRAVVVLGHRDVDKTQCPGIGVYAQIKAGVFEPVDEPAPVPVPVPVPQPTPMPPASPSEEEDMTTIVRDDDGRIRVGNGVNQIVYDATDKAVNFVITRHVRAANAGFGRKLISDDGSRCVEVDSIDDVLTVSDSGARSLGRGGTA